MWRATCVSARVLALIAAGFAPAVAVQAAERFASIIIDDLGTSFERAVDVANIPGPVTVAILPETDYASTAAELANSTGKDVILHLPMQSVSHHKQTPGTLLLHMSEEQFTEQVKTSLMSVPYLKGVNNHMGSLLTRHPGHMKWLMSTLVDHGPMFFIDSRTTDKTVAKQLAEEYDIPSVERDVFLDPDFDPATVEEQFDRFIRLAKENGSALAIAHPHPVTIAKIRERLDELEENGIRLVSISKYVELRNKRHVTCTGSTCAGM